MIYTSELTCCSSFVDFTKAETEPEISPPEVASSSRLYARRHSDGLLLDTIEAARCTDVQCLLKGAKLVARQRRRLSETNLLELDSLRGKSKLSQVLCSQCDIHSAAMYTRGRKLVRQRSIDQLSDGRTSTSAPRVRKTMSSSAAYACGQSLECHVSYQPEGTLSAATSQQLRLSVEELDRSSVSTEETALSPKSLPADFADGGRGSSWSDVVVVKQRHSSSGHSPLSKLLSFMKKSTSSADLHFLHSSAPKVSKSHMSKSVEHGLNKVGASKVLFKVFRKGKSSQCSSTSTGSRRHSEGHIQLSAPQVIPLPDFHDIFCDMEDDVFEEEEGVCHTISEHSKHHMFDLPGLSMDNNNTIELTGKFVVCKFVMCKFVMCKLSICEFSMCKFSICKFVMCKCALGGRAEG